MRPVIIKGWDISKEEYKRAHQEGRLVKLLIELSNICNLSCPSCFTKRVKGSFNDKRKKRLSNEMLYMTQIQLLEEACRLGVKTVDIVGAGEPTLDPHFQEIVEKINDLGMYVVVFTHGASRLLENISNFKDKKISLFFKLWSRKRKLQDRYVAGSISNYSKKRDENLERFILNGFNEGEDIMLDGIEYKTTRLGADILVMRSNYNEILDIFRFTRNNNIMPLIKTYIPQGPTHFSQIENLGIYSSERLKKLKEEEISQEEMFELRKKLIDIDSKEYGILELKTFYPQAVKCTQSVASLYATITGEIRSCVGTDIVYGVYEPKKNMLEKIIKKRREKVGFGCLPRIEDSRKRGIEIPRELMQIYEDGIF